jgi:S-adenosylmethionine uptake transporter
MQGAVLWLGFYFWDRGLVGCSLLIVTVMGFMIPLFTLILCRVFLKEKINLSVIYCNIFFIILFFIVLMWKYFSFALNQSLIFLLLGSLFFALMDVLQKNYFNAQKHHSILNIIAVQSFWVLLITFFLEKKENIFIAVWHYEIMNYVVLLSLSTSLMIGLWLFCLKNEKILSRIQPLYYFNFIVSFLFDLFFFKTAFDPVMAVFCFLIFIGLIYFIAQDLSSDQPHHQ